MIIDDLFREVEAGKVGAFNGRVHLIWNGPLDYTFDQRVEEPFLFIRSNGDIVLPDSIKTDGGSIPRPLWNLPGMSPWDYMPAYIIHDFLFTKKPCTFDEANLILAEMLVAMNCPKARVVAIYEGVTLGGRSHWN